MVFTETSWDPPLILTYRTTYFPKWTGSLSWLSQKENPGLVPTHSDTNPALSHEALCAHLTRAWDPQEMLRLQPILLENKEGRISLGSSEPKNLPSVSTFCRMQAFYPLKGLSPQASGIAPLGLSTSKTRTGKAHPSLITPSWSYNPRHSREFYPPPASRAFSLPLGYLPLPFPDHFCNYLSNQFLNRVKIK